MAVGTVTHLEMPNSSPTPATPANSVSSAPIAESTSVPAETRPHFRPKFSRINCPWPLPVQIPSLTVISCTAKRIGMSTTCGSHHRVAELSAGLRGGDEAAGVGVGQHHDQAGTPAREHGQQGPVTSGQGEAPNNGRAETGVLHLLVRRPLIGQVGCHR